MSYADLVAGADYQAKKTGAMLHITLTDEADPAAVIIGAGTSYSLQEAFEVVPIEEAGNDGVDEHAQGRHSGSGSIAYFWTPERSDALLSRQSFIGRRFTVFIKGGKGHAFEGTVLEALQGVTINAQSSAFQARGARNGDLAFNFLRRYTGKEWSALTGT